MIDLKTKQGSITLTAPKASGGGSVDLSNYYTKAETDEQIQLAINSIEIPEVDLTDYAKKSEIPDVSLFVTGEYVQNSINSSLPDLTPYAKTEDIPDVSGFIKEIPSEYVTDEELTAKGYLTEHQSLEGYAKISDIPDVTPYQTQEQVIALIAEYGGSGGSLPASEEGEF